MINSKKKMKNICLVTWYNALNYGTCLQSYALVTIIKNLGYNVYIPETLKYYYWDFFDHPFITIKRIFELFQNKYTKRNKKIILHEEYVTRQSKINDFVFKYNNIYLIKSYFDFIKMQKDTDIYLTGSDQIWNPYILREAFLLTFVKDKKRKVAYSSSIGVNEIPKCKRRLYKRALSQFYKIGVREKTAQVVLSNLLNRNIQNVLDPVYLLDKNNWYNIISKVPHKINDDFILCYFVGTNISWQVDIKKLSDKEKIQVHTITSEARIIPDFGFVHADYGIDDFLASIYNAKYVITDSFHAIAFCIIFNKNFVVYKRFKDNEGESQNSRIYDILRLFKLEDRLISSYDDLENILNKQINYENVNNILEQERSKSLDFLMEELK